MMLSRNLVGSFSVFALLTALSGGCAPQVPSTARLVSITFTPAGEDPVRTVTAIDYDGDGYPERVEVERDGVELQEDLFSFNSDGELEEIVSAETSGTFSFTTTTAYDWTDGRVTRLSSEGSGVDDPEGDNVSYTTSSERDLTYDDQGRLAGSTSTSNVHLEQEYDFIIFTSMVTVDLDETGEETYDWSNDGTLASVDSDDSATTVTKTDDEETNRTSEVTTAEITLDYDDQGVIEDMDYETSSVETDAEMNETTTSRSAGFDFRFSDDGQATDIDLSTAQGSASDSDSFEIEYDDEGRIASIENDDGDVWELEYDDEPVAGVTFGAATLPPAIDIAGRQALPVLGSPIHFLY